MKYTLVNEIGSGGMGCVYMAKGSDGRSYAVKQLSKEFTYDPDVRNMFYNESNTLRQLNHPSVVKIIDEPYQDEAGNLYLPMELVQGQNILQKVRNKSTGKITPMSEHDACELMIKVLDAMDYIHRHDKIHRDIKPTNIMVRPDNSVCVIDFGIAKDTKLHTGKTIGQVIGTHGYMSPEQAEGLSIDTRTDIYSLGCTLFFMLTGHDPIAEGKNNYETRYHVMQNTIPPVSSYVNVSNGLDSIVSKATDKNMMKRYQTASDFRSALQNHLNGAQPETVTSTSKTVSVGSQDDNDIVINSPYVSRHHATITCTPSSTDGEYTLEFTDHSTNGTGVDGLYYKDKSTTVIYRFDGTAHLPTVLLAGRDETPLNWQDVIRILKARGVIAAPSEAVKPDEPDSLGCGLGLLIFLIPIVGFVRYGSDRKEYPKKAKAELWVAILGVVVGIIINAILRN